ncbi:hypothetical protein JOC36_001464 [Weissella uvarum]|uniref:hypothetical protein n=1 Tax=Weissella uvarum TaxID=1479233 RepID=UPI00196099DF|nr:hypothetical protein [Weissella uvarum]MBM7617871.1 hypothetical protein [Weissella uvarum]MCM0596131.1 hypothetical protein [Weissella uvarum]
MFNEDISVVATVEVLEFNEFYQRVLIMPDAVKNDNDVLVFKATSNVGTNDQGALIGDEHNLYLTGKFKGFNLEFEIEQFPNDMDQVLYVESPQEFAIDRQSFQKAWEELEQKHPYLDNLSFIEISYDSRDKSILLNVPGDEEVDDVVVPTVDVDVSSLCNLDVSDSETYKRVADMLCVQADYKNTRFEYVNAGLPGQLAEAVYSRYNRVVKIMTSPNFMTHEDMVRELEFMN